VLDSVGDEHDRLEDGERQKARKTGTRSRLPSNHDIAETALARRVLSGIAPLLAVAAP
jgi:hypothetical protein